IAQSGNHYRAVFTNGTVPDATTSAALLTVNKAGTTTALTQSPTSAPFGSPVTIKAAISRVGPGSGTPGGSVQFKQGSTNLGPPVAVTGGQAIRQVPFILQNQVVTAVYSGDANFLGSQGQFAPAISFVHTLGNQPGNTTISGGTWLLSGITIGGSLTVSPGTSVLILNSTIRAGVTATKPGTVAICGSALRSALNISAATGFVLVGDPADDACAGNSISGAVNLTNNLAGVSLRSNQVLSGVTFNKNVGGGPFPLDVNPVVAANIISGRLACTGNTPVLTNIAQPNTASLKSGQCAGL
ncbi:MAG TPA: Ig-like domain repeat protein, partial [Acidimicrobiales bacterium]|nr:Ig-like domain repeat protein [Acidimicrobiales bacterium]